MKLSNLLAKYPTEERRVTVIKDRRFEAHYKQCSLSEDDAALQKKANKKLMSLDEKSSYNTKFKRFQKLIVIFSTKTDLLFHLC